MHIEIGITIKYTNVPMTKKIQDELLDTIREKLLKYDPALITLDKLHIDRIDSQEDI